MLHSVKRVLGNYEELSAGTAKMYSFFKMNFLLQRVIRFFISLSGNKRMADSMRLFKPCSEERVRELLIR